jgi:hypothetical protein
MKRHQRTIDGLELDEDIFDDRCRVDELIEDPRNEEPSWLDSAFQNAEQREAAEW